MNIDKYIKKREIQDASLLPEKVLKKIKKKYLYSESSQQLLWQYRDLFNISLQRNFKKTMQALIQSSVPEDDFLQSVSSISTNIDDEINFFYDILEKNKFACTDKTSYSMMMKENPSYLEKSFTFDFNGTINQCCNYYSRDNSISVNTSYFGFNLEEILKRKNFILTPDNYSILEMGVEPLLVSLNTDCQKTIDVLIPLINQGKLNTDKTKESYSAALIENIFKKNNFVIDEKKLAILNIFPFLLKVSLENDFQKTINLIAKLEKEGTNNLKPVLQKLFSSADYIYANRIKTNFVLSEENINLLKHVNYLNSFGSIGRSLVYLSFNNDFNKTAESLSAIHRSDLSWREMTEKVTLPKDFVINPKNENLVLSNPVMFLASYIRNKEATIDYLRKTGKKFEFHKKDIEWLLSGYILFLTQEGVEEAIKHRFAISSDYFTFDTKEISNLIIESINGDYGNNIVDTWNSFKEEHIEKLLKDAPSFVPKEILLTRPEVYKNNYSPEQCYVIETEYLKASKQYSAENENILLSTLGEKFNSLEQYVISLAKKEIKDLSLLELTALNMYAKKELKKANIDYVDVEFIDTRGEMNECGSYDDTNEKLSIYINSRNPYSKCLSIISDINHEIEHVKQFYNIRNCQFQNDINILTYSEDEILRKFADGYYYHDNYIKMAIEFDARFKADMKMHQIMGTLDTLYEEIKQDIKVRISGFDYEYGNRSKNRLEFEDNDILRLHKGEQIPCYVLFEKYFPDKLKENGDELRKIIEKEFPIISYEYDLNTGRRKTLSELLDCIDNAQTEQEAQTYWYLINQRYVKDRAMPHYMTGTPELYSIDTLPQTHNKYIDSLLDIIKNVDSELYTSQLRSIQKSTRK